MCVCKNHCAAQGCDREDIGYLHAGKSYITLDVRTFAPFLVRVAIRLIVYINTHAGREPRTKPSRSLVAQPKPVLALVTTRAVPSFCVLTLTESLPQLQRGFPKEESIERYLHRASFWPHTLSQLVRTLRLTVSYLQFKPIGGRS